MGDVQNRLDHHRFRSVLRPSVPDAECLMKPKLTHAVLPVEFRQPFLHLLRRGSGCEPHRQRADPVPDAGIVYPAFLFVSLIGEHLTELGNLKRAGNRRKIKGEQLPENGDVVKHGRVDRSLHRPADLTGAAVAVFMIHQKIAQIAVPQIAVEAVAPAELQKAAHAGVQLRARLPAFLLKMAGNPGHLRKELPVLSEISVYNQFFFSHPASSFPCV